VQIHIGKKGQNYYFLVKNGLFICEIEIRGRKWRNVSTANFEWNLYLLNVEGCNDIPTFLTPNFTIKRCKNSLTSFSHTIVLAFSECKVCFVFLTVYLGCKVHKSKGRTLFVVSVYPSKNKLGCLRNKIHLFTFTSCFLSNPALQ
jgi:hypothetical protein